MNCLADKGRAVSVYKESPVPQQGLILPVAAVSPPWDSKPQLSSLAVLEVALMAAAHVYGGA